MATRYATKQRASVTVNVESGPWGALGNLGRWDKREGGLADSEETKIRPAGLGEIAIGGVQTADNVTCSRIYHLDRDRAIIAALRAARGKADASASQETLDAHENPTGDMSTWAGVLKSVMIFEADTTSNDEAEIVIEISTSSPVVGP